MMKKLCILIYSAIVAFPAFGDDGPKLELNTLTQADAVCRMTFTTQSAVGIEKLTTEMVLFDKLGSVLLLTLFDCQDFPAGKLRVRQFDIPDTNCAELGQVLINGVHECVGQGCAPLTAETRVDSVEVLG